MATNFPTSLDSLTNPTASDKLNSVTVPHASQHADINDAVEALEAKVGVDGSSVVTSHDYLIDKQSVVPYDDASARTTAVPSPVEGQMSYLKDTNSVEVYDGSGWVTLGGGGLVSYTPTWSVPAGTTPTIGNGSLTGKYTVINNWCVGSIRLALGSTSSISGTSEWRFSFPVTPVNISAYDTVGAALAVNVGTAGHRGTAFFLANTIAVYGSDVANTVGSTTPFTWSPASGDYLTISFSYEVA